MRRTTKKYLYIGGGILTLVLIIAAFGYFSQTAFVIDRVYGLNSDFTALLGTKVSGNDMQAQCEALPSNDEQNLCYVNTLLDNVYGYVIFDGPAKVNSDSKTQIVRSMTMMNTEVKRPDEYTQFTKDQKKIWDKTFGKGIFSTTLISKIKKSSYTYADMQTIAVELDKSLNVWCNGLNTIFMGDKFDQFYKDDRKQIDSEMDVWLQICAKKPDKMFAITKDTIKLNMVDIDLYEYNRYETICEAPQPCKPDSTGYVEYCPITACQIKELPQTEKKYLGTLKLSDNQIQIRKLGPNDYIFAANAGVSESAGITSQLDFAKYILQMPVSGGIDLNTDRDFPMTKPGFAIFTTNAKVTKLITDVQDMRSRSTQQ